jgi:hypothetical protein
VSCTPAAANQVRNIVRQQFQQLATSGIQGFNAIWRNPRATPAAVVAALGTDAAAIFQLAGLNIQTVQAAAAIGGVAPPTIPEVPSSYTLTFNSDGSATLTLTPPSSNTSGGSSATP